MQISKVASPFKYLAILYLLVSIALRLVFLFHPITTSNFTPSEWLNIFALGLTSDLLVFILASVILWLYLLLLSESKYHSPWGYVMWGGYILLFLYILSGHSILTEYGGPLAYDRASICRPENRSGGHYAYQNRESTSDWVCMALLFSFS
ncbi:hypothetical protein [Dyadobacter tibetensis]|uniref:hypothetical protein n=1 Tax=Dyadobacter tibetensis TaxID=1211851 RepID=UPI000472EF5D|nr:hypothetical protein [Dyadobacter tibetensis]